jgi:hypothetical protein
MNNTLIVRLIKDFKKPADLLYNLRPISLSNTIAHIFERIMKFKIDKLRNTHSNQFGYVNKTSSTHELFAFKETILSYLENKHECFAVTLDAVKAFDSVWREYCL